MPDIAPAPVSPGGTSGFIPSFGTHDVERGEGRVRIKRVELFTTMKEGESALGAVDETRLFEIAASTNERMRKFGMHPNLIETHDPKAEVIGRVPGPVHMGIGMSGEPTIFGDLEMSEANYAKYMASGKYPRRSVEVSLETSAILDVAILGRERPAALLPDVVVHQAGAKSVCVTAAGLAPTIFRNGPATAPSNPARVACTPETGPLRSDTMTLVELIAKFSTDAASLSAADRDAYYAAVRTTVAPVTAPGTANHSAAGVTAAAPPVAPKPAPSRAVQAGQAVLSTEVASLRTALTASESALHAAQSQLQTHAAQFIDLAYRQRLETMRTVGGYTTLDVNEEMKRIVGFSADADRENWVKHIEKNYARTTTGAAISAVAPFAHMTAPPTTSAGKVAEFSEADRDAVVAIVSSKRVGWEEAKAIHMKTKAGATATA